jgi:hypothetical protein
LGELSLYLSSVFGYVFRIDEYKSIMGFLGPLCPH